MNPETYLVKREVIDAILLGTNLKEDPEFVATLQQEVQWENLEKEAYIPLEAANQIQNLVARRFYPDLPIEEALRNTGRISIEGYRKTMVGRILLTALDVWGPVRTVKNAPQLLSGVLGYGKRSVKQLEPNHYQIIFEDTPAQYPLIAGVAEGALQMSGAKNLKIAIQEPELNTVILDISWD